MTTELESAKQPPRWPAAALPLAGLIYCVASAFDLTEAICVTEGCKLFENVALFGLSLWWWGAAAFGLIFGLVVARRIGLALFVAVAAVSLDVLLLALMAFYATCVSCLVGGAIFFFTFLAVAYAARRRLVMALIAVVWVAALSPNVVSAVQEQVGPWAIHGAPEAPLKLFFSPTCPACRHAVQDVVSSNPDGVELYPLARSNEDMLRIACMLKQLEAGRPFLKAFEGCSGDLSSIKHLGVWESVSLRLRLLRNWTSYKRMNVNKLPLMFMTGWRSQEPNQAAGPPQSAAKPK